ncbi:MAG TPA: hypothetical protein VNT79_06785, partial [Phycisphaerae bacterium]|nr:hypothetical protein [Phycisphaerae bacterium]
MAGPAGGGDLGRCCFWGFNPSEPLCEVTTQEQCFNNTAPISWTPGLTCETPCEVFAGCGTLGPGPQSCTMFHADNGESFALENDAAPFNGHVFVRGVVEPESSLCFPVIVTALRDNIIC